MPWEMSRQGLLKHLLNEEHEHAHGDGRRLHADHPAGQPVRTSTATWPRSASTCWRARGYDLHQDCDVEITDTYHWKPQDEVKRFEWEAGDVIYIPPNTIHQHFNADPTARRG